jgi:GxxExxY protein
VVYQRALAQEFQSRGLEFGGEVWIDIFYKGSKVGRKRVDFVVEEVMLEIKAKSMLDEIDFQQTHSYLLASEYPIGSLVNFGG